MNPLLAYFLAHLLLFVPILSVLGLVAVNAIPAVRKLHLPLVSFVARYYKLLLALIPFVYLYTTNDQDGWLFKTFGPALYPPALCFEAVVLFLLARHFWLNKTADADAATGQYERDWRAVEPHVRIYATVALTVGILFAIAHIVAGTGK